MAAGDLTKHDDHHGTSKLVFGTIEGPASYATGGIAPTLAKFGLTSVDFVHCQVKSAATTAVIGRYDAATDKILLYGGAASGVPLAEIAAATNVSAYEIKFQAWGH